MSHWYHRNVLKATTLVNYDTVFTGNFDFTKLASDLKKFRNRLLELLPDASNNMETVNTAFVAYLSLMCGFFMDHKISGRKVRYLFPYKWTHTLLGHSPQMVKDAAFDMANMAVNVGLWHMKRASFLTSRRSVSMDEAKEIHTCLRKGAGIFLFIQKDLVPMLEPGLPNSDLDPKILSAYCNQCIAEAQEVTIARAITLEHNNSLISALSNETSQMFKTAEDQLKGLNKSIVGQWLLYLEVKKNLYLSYAHCYGGKKCMAENKFGEAIRSLKESEAYYKMAFTLCQSYSKMKGPAKPVKPHGHLFFLQLNSTVSSLLEQCERENGFIYHQKVPDTPPELEMKATFVLASPEAYILPAPSPLWQAAFAKAQDLPELKDKEINAAFKKELVPMVEIESEENPVVDHGCTVQ